MSENLPSQSPKDLQKATELDATAKETLIAIMGTHTITAAAEKLGIDRVTVYKRINKYNLRPVIEGSLDKAVLALKMGSVNAAENLVRKVKSHDQRISLEASKEVLDRIGVSDKTPSNIQQFNVKGGMEVSFIEHDEGQTPQGSNTSSEG